MYYIKDDCDRLVAVKRIEAKLPDRYICEVLGKEGCVKGWLSDTGKLCWAFSKDVFEQQYNNIVIMPIE